MTPSSFAGAKRASACASSPPKAWPIGYSLFLLFLVTQRARLCAREGDLVTCRFDHFLVDVCTVLFPQLLVDGVKEKTLSVLQSLRYYLDAYCHILGDTLCGFESFERRVV